MTTREIERKMSSDELMAILSPAPWYEARCVKLAVTAYAVATLIIWVAL